MEEKEENTVEVNKSMEELKMEEEDNRETSMEDDILGAQSLLMSESESDEDADIDCVSKMNKRSRRLLDSDDDLENIEAEAQSDKKQNLIKNKISTLVDSDSDSDQKDFNTEENNPTENLKLNDKQEKTTKQRDKWSISPHKKKVLEVNKNLEIEHESHLDGVENETKNGFSIVDTDSSDTESGTEINGNDMNTSFRNTNSEENNNEITTDKNKKTKVVRASAKKAMDEMQAIQSEQQRLQREQHISIPYHKPRKHTLDEFLMRRTIIQPQKTSPVAAVIQARRLKMSTEELEEYAKLMEDRAKEATEFFKSESDNEQEEVLKHKKVAAENEENSVSISKEQNKIDMQERSTAHIKLTDDLTENHVSLQPTEEKLSGILDEGEMRQLEQPICSKVLITEVIELPRLDMNTVRISPDKNHTPRSSLLNLKQLLVEKNLSESPSLSGDPNKLIDLETGNLIDKKPSGMENLMNRLMSTIKSRKSIKSETCNIISIENGKLEMSKVKVVQSEVKNPQKESKPGAAYYELKRNLKEIITKKRLEEINKKQEDELEYSKCLADDDDDQEEDEMGEMIEREYEPNNKNKTVVVDEEENSVEVENDVDVTSADEEDECKAENEEENEAHGENEDENKECTDTDEDEENYDNTKSLEKSQRKNRIIKAFDDSDEEEGDKDDIDFLKTQPIITQPSLFETQTPLKTLEDEENELIALCSGTFDETQKTSYSALMSQIPTTHNGGNTINDEELIQLCSGTFDQNSVSQEQTQFEEISDRIKTKNKKILSSDEENDDEPKNRDDKNRQQVKKLTKRLRIKKAKLGFSDDEDEDEDENQYEYDNREEDEQINNKIQTTVEEPEIFVDYDSEENEILVKMTKNDKVFQAQNFFEKEAELSESEWGSADEDENNLDKYDIELGDEDEFDREKLQTELGKIHARKMLDDDIREVRKIQEMLFEDEEKDGVGRQRTFKWKNAESGFSLEDKRPLDENGDDINVDSGDEINEHQWRKIRYERENFLREQGLKPNSQDLSTVLSNTSSPLNSTATISVTSKKLQIITTKKATISTSDIKKDQPFLISKGLTAMHKKSVRGSFLVRDKETLNKLAGLSKGTSTSIAATDIDDTADTISIKSTKLKNFVFVTLTEEEHEKLKRKADDLLNSSNENGKNFLKKPKIEPRRDKCFIDQLL